MKKSLLILLISLSLFSCSERIVELPETTNNEITEVKDVSSIYFFYNEESGGAEFNRKNMISSTNWLVAVDKRLRLKQIAQDLQYLYEKRHSDGMHSNKEAKNYFACSSITKKELSFIEFTKVKYLIEDMGRFMEDFFANKNNTDTENFWYINVKSLESITFGNQTTVSTFSLTDFETQLQSINNSNIKHTLHLTINDDLTFQDYISIKTSLLKYKNINISNEELLYIL